jgi:hypothetical protein
MWNGGLHRGRASGLDPYSHQMRVAGSIPVASTDKEHAEIYRELKKTPATDVFQNKLITIITS